MPYKAKNSCLVVKIQKAFCKKLSKFVAKKANALQSQSSSLTYTLCGAG